MRCIADRQGGTHPKDASRAYFIATSFVVKRHALVGPGLGCVTQTVSSFALQMPPIAPPKPPNPPPILMLINVLTAGNNSVVQWSSLTFMIDLS